MRSGVGEEEAGEFEGGLVAAVEAGDEAGGVGVGGGAVRGEGDIVEHGAEFVEELAIGGEAGLEEEAFGDETEDAVEGVVDGEFVEGAGEAVLAVGAAELVGDAEFATKQREVVIEGLVGAVRGGVEFAAEIGCEETGEEFEPVVGLVMEGGGVVDEIEVVGVGEHGEEILGGFAFTLFAIGSFGAMDFGEDLEGEVGEAENADVLGGAQGVVLANFDHFAIRVSGFQQSEVAVGDCEAVGEFEWRMFEGGEEGHGGIVTGSGGSVLCGGRRAKT